MPHRPHRFDVARALALQIAACAIGSSALAAGDSQPAYRPTLIDESSSTACGPIACYVAARSLKIEVPLDEFVRLCDWSPGRRVSIRRLRDVMADTAGLDATAVRTGPFEVRDALRTRQCAIILAVRNGSESIDHAVVAVHADEEQITIVDYPGLVSTLTLDELADRWDDAAIMVIPDDGASASDVLAAMPMTIGLTLVLMVFVAIQTVRTREEIVRAVARLRRRGVST